MLCLYYIFSGQVQQKIAIWGIELRLFGTVWNTLNSSTAFWNYHVLQQVQFIRQFFIPFIVEN